MSTEEIPGWKSTVLWAELLAREGGTAETLRAKLSEVMPKIEAVLDKGGTMPATFTLHDSGHARRVAERIGEIAGPELVTRLGDYEIASLLLAAYLHDIGMTPPLARLDATLAYVLSADPDALTATEQEELQGWLDDQPEGLVPPLAEGPPTAKELQRAREIVAGYVRFRHSDWSEGWIRENLAHLNCETYGGWLDDIVLLCQSHQASADELKGTVFDLRLVGAPSSILNLRYAACLLRIADVLEFDPERTPKILFSHRDVNQSSAIFWHKDHNLSFALKRGKISIHATSPNAVTERAIRATVEQVDEELLACRRIADETQMLGSPSIEVPHGWPLETSVHAKITARNNAYEYVEGTFRPDPMKVLELIGGLALYGTHLAAVRELLQNAFDAVRDQIARQRLLRECPGEAGLYETLAATHQVSLTLSQEPDGVRLICEDSGCGMSRDVITSRFLVGGRAASRDSRALERDCNAHGFSTGRTARFGIGVLSYFLIASEFDIRTRRSIEAGDPDGTGWIFRTEGLEDFGELRRESTAPTGTRVEMKLAPEVVGDPQEFSDKLRKYLLQELRRLPCPFKFNTEGFSTPAFSGTQGWLERSNDAEAQLVSGLRPSGGSPHHPTNELLSTADREEQEERVEYWKRLREKARSALALQYHEAELPDGLGFYRIYFGGFTMFGEPALTFVNAENDGNEKIYLRSIDNRDAFLPSGEVAMSWNGMQIRPIDSEHLYRGKTDNVLVEIDWTSDRAGQLAVHRNSFELSEAAQVALSKVVEEANKFRREFTQAGIDSPFGMMNSRIAGSEPSGELRLLWPDRPKRKGKEDRTALEPLRFPLIPPTYKTGERRITWRGVPVTQLGNLSLKTSAYKDEVPFWQGSKAGPTAVGFLKTDISAELVPVWEDFDPSRFEFMPHLGYQCHFPPEWGNLAGAVLENVVSGMLMVWNPEHPLVQALDLDSWQWARTTFMKSRDPLQYVDELLDRPGRMAAWIVLCLTRGERPLWAGLGEHAADFLANAWGALHGSDSEDPIVFQRESYFEKSTDILSPVAWKSHPNGENGPELGGWLAPPGQDWQFSEEAEPKD
jgi:hypothetical protein